MTKNIPSTPEGGKDFVRIPEGGKDFVRIPEGGKDFVRRYEERVKEEEIDFDRYEEIIDKIIDISDNIKETKNRFSLVNKRIIESLNECGIDKVILRGGDIRMKRQTTLSNISKKDLIESNLSKESIERVWSNRVYKETESIKYSSI
jgi:hypothetical protein